MTTRRGFGLAAGTPAAAVPVLAARIEELGYGSLWSRDAPGDDGVALVAAAAPHARRIALGVGVVSLARDSPMVIAARVREHSAPLDRLLLGVGSGASPTPVATVRSAVAALGEHLPGVSIVVAAMGPAMCRLAGEIAGGVLLNWVTPAWALWARERVAEGAARAGRDPATVTVYGYVRCGIGETARRALAAEATAYAGIDAYARHFARLGVRPEDAGEVVDDPRDLDRRLSAYTALDAVVVRALRGDTPDRVAELAEAARSRGRGSGGPAGRC